MVWVGNLGIVDLKNIIKKSLNVLDGGIVQICVFDFFKEQVQYNDSGGQILEGRKSVVQVQFFLVNC